jgi:hypothetical protein
MMLNIGHLGKKIRNTRKFLKCGSREEWRRSFGPSVWKITKYYIESRRRGVSYKN